MMTVLEYEKDKYHILKEESFSDYTGSFRIIQYDTGVYALQKLVNESWVTVLISPILDDNDADSMFSSIVYYGRMNVEEMFKYIGEADRSFNGDYWELQLFLSEWGDENFTEIITRGDGETLLGQIKELFDLEKEQRLVYMENYPRVQLLLYSCLLVFLIIVLVAIVVFGGRL